MFWVSKAGIHKILPFKMCGISDLICSLGISSLESERFAIILDWYVLYYFNFIEWNSLILHPTFFFLE